MTIGFDDLDEAPVSGNETIRQNAHIVNGGEAITLKTCPKCNGRGVRTYGYVNITTYACGWCKRTGKISDKREANIVRAIKADATRKDNEQRNRDAFRREHAAEFEFMARASEWSTFYASLLEGFNRGGKLSENQIAAIRNGMAKAAAKRAEKEAAKPTVDVSAIEALFDNARASGLKRLSFRTKFIDISAAKETSSNPGALYVKHGGEYVGKIASGKFHATYAAKADTLTKVLEVAADPLGMAILYGKEVGKCSCCGRELTDPISIANGIGPICQTKWGM